MYKHNLFSSTSNSKKKFSVAKLELYGEASSVCFKKKQVVIDFSTGIASSGGANDTPREKRASVSTSENYNKNSFRSNSYWCMMAWMQPETVTAQVSSKNTTKKNSTQQLSTVCTKQGNALITCLYVCQQHITYHGKVRFRNSTIGFIVTVKLMGIVTTLLRIFGYFLLLEARLNNVNSCFCFYLICFS